MSSKAQLCEVHHLNVSGHIRHPIHISSKVLVKSPKPYEAMCFNLPTSFIGSIRRTWMGMPQMLPEVHRVGSLGCIILVYIDSLPNKQLRYQSGSIIICH